MTRVEFEAACKAARAKTQREWPSAPRFPEHEYQLPILLDLFFAAQERIEQLERRVAELELP